MATVKDIYNYIQVINPSMDYASSIGYYKGSRFQTAEWAAQQLLGKVSKDSTAYKILFNGECGKFSDKQMWCIAYELIKNEAYCKEVDELYTRLNREAEAKKQQSKAKLAANKEASSDILVQVKAAGKLLKDYYAWLKVSNYKKEFFSKKYSQTSVDAFLAQA